MRLSNFLCIVLALILVIGILSLPVELIDQKSNDNETNTENGDTTDKTPDLIVTEAHDPIVCPECGVISTAPTIVENYGSIGEVYSAVYCIPCDLLSDIEEFSLYHEYSNKDGICTARGCGRECTHTFTKDAISYVIPYDDRFSMFDAGNLIDGSSAVHEGVCTICQKSIPE